MSRIRTVKPELFRHEALYEAEVTYQLPLRLAFIALFTCCDREGRFRWRPRQLKLDVLPYDDIDFSRVLDALAAHGFVVKYEVKGELYGCIPSWNKHQYINNKEIKSELPAYDQPNVQTSSDNHENHALNTPNERDIDVIITPNEVSSLCLYSSRGEYGREGNMEKEGDQERENERDQEKENIIEKNLVASNATTPMCDENVNAIFSYWQTVMSHPGAKLDKKRKAYIRKALQDGYSVTQLCDAIKGCSLTPHNMGINNNNQRYDGLHVILGNADQIDRFIRNSKSPPKLINASERVTQNNINTLQNWLDKKRTNENQEDMIDV